MNVSMAKLTSSATVAQLVEQRIRNAQAVGSSPTSSSIRRERFARGDAFQKHM